jgi:hypothetical protein
MLDILVFYDSFFNLIFGLDPFFNFDNFAFIIFIIIRASFLFVFDDIAKLKFSFELVELVKIKVDSLPTFLL